MLQYIEEAKQGDRQAFEQIVKHFTPMANAVAFEKLRDYQLAEDAVQEAFTEAFLHLNKLRAVEAFPGWFKAIVVRQCYRILRRKQHPALPYDEAAQATESSFSIADIIEKKETQRLVHESIAALTSNMRIAVQLYYFQGYSLQEIADFLGTSVSVLKKRLFDARRKLKGALPVADVLSVFNHLYEGGKAVLHIVNGDVVGEKLRQGIVKGDVLVWREVYSHGPVFLDPADGDNRAVRAQYLEQTMGIPQREFIANSERQEKILADFHKYEEVVLWFEHDLFDQTMLSYLLHWFSKQKMLTTKLSLLCIGEYPGIKLFRGLGQLSIEQMETLSGTWKLIGAKELEAGQALWEAYVSPNPELLQQRLTTDTSALPFAHDAFRAHLSRFPSTTNGLGIVEQITLEMIHEGIKSPYELFKNVGDKLHILGMGDLQYWHILRKMVQGTYPLLQTHGCNEFPVYNDSVMQFKDCELVLTELGKSVIAGNEDWVQKNGSDEWFGGVHLQGLTPRWRWNPLVGALQERSAEA
ncbi:RNA polymerase subunit sigma [Paenibacillus odorifer]|jgi:RNA polymerase sigma factor (sigma-70 family)|uniref:sigma-70 family RNA polymerase sigma factor n=1 Tax=Paenibacillus TaxID=44249 RepID=UPI00096E482F|nr:sigma-70 family RNA polymerase sigma factor [Paenibacillus odorifer]OMD82530.1 RNA polymerase subunit sigma [Paenibacillus odorifer]OMD92512.1 RNA polymerase subunit sigma [Paenibacillus odorifer]